MWRNVHVVEADACEFVPPEGAATLVTFSYSLSSEWEQEWGWGDAGTAGNVGRGWVRLQRCLLPTPCPCPCPPSACNSPNTR